MEEEIDFRRPPRPDCNYEGDKLDVQGMIDRMKIDKTFQRFIRGQLRKAFGEDENAAAKAVECLKLYFLPAPDELTDLQLSPAGTFVCTEHGRLIQSVAYGY